MTFLTYCRGKVKPNFFLHVKFAPDTYYVTLLDFEGSLPRTARLVPIEWTDSTEITVAT